LPDRFVKAQIRNLLPAAPLIALLLIAAVAALSCGTGKATGNDPGHFAKSGAEVTVDLRVDPFPPRPMDKASFTITLTDRKGGPMGGATVLCDMTMPAMMMPPNRPQAVEIDPGVYVADVLFTMAGDWQAAVGVTLPGVGTETFEFAMSTR
jgi:hypothetical protein